MKITRRELAFAVAASAAAAPALAQNPPASAPAQAPDWDRMARDAHQQSAQALTTVDLPMLVEPAFVFKA